MKETLFRPAALRRVSSPEQLDKAVRVTLPRQWLALAALTAVVAAGVAWSALSTVPTLISGLGYLLPRTGLDQVASAVSGTLSRFSIHAGEYVRAGQTVGAVQTAGGRAVPLVSGFSGHVIEVDDAAGDVISVGQRLALIEPAGKSLVVYAYVPIREAQALPPGLPVRVSFNAGIGAAYGYAKGTVTRVSRFAVSQARLHWVLQNIEVINSVNRMGPVDEVLVKLTPSSHTPSGLVWASGNGPPGRVPPLVSAKVQFVLGSHHPISNVL
jgi:biotin carboxyl carrier protein